MYFGQWLVEQSRRSDEIGDFSMALRLKEEELLKEDPSFFEIAEKFEYLGQDAMRVLALAWNEYSELLD